ncbi:MAG TPA: Dyp-type peroxidase [Acidimicrobiales bacterium]|nr:Dyp-type peroxidase [Acidimicrobiales bacterium]
MSTELQLDLDDMQGLVARAYGHLPFARYLLCEIAEPAKARAWLGGVAGEVNTAARREEERSLVVAFTWTGLARLGLDDEALATFPRPLQEGIVTEHRSRVLGDAGPSDPTGWRWGGPANPAVHVLVVLYAATLEGLDADHRRHRAAFAGGLVEVGDPIEGLLADGGREHFGFADGLSQPLLKGWPKRTRSVQPPALPPPIRWEEVNPGEIVLGYPDNYDKPAEGPTVAARTDRGSLLPEATWARGRRSLGHNGSFLVFRQLAQDVAAFRRFVDAASRASAARGTPLPPALVGAKMVGRWASGASLVVHPHTDPGEAGTNDFGYHDEDQAGLRCPAGAHVRRTNPRDASSSNPAKALVSTKNHRILRRGRPYGLPLADPPTRPGEEEAAERGLLFLCLNSDFERQFEFVQHTWIENGFFAGLRGEVDPLVGTQPAGGGSFTVPAPPVRRRLDGVPTLVTTKGGGYFFLPGVRALRYLAAIGA